MQHNPPPPPIPGRPRPIGCVRYFEKRTHPSWLIWARRRANPRWRCEQAGSTFISPPQESRYFPAARLRIPLAQLEEGSLERAKTMFLQRLCFSHFVSPRPLPGTACTWRRPFIAQKTDWSEFITPNRGLRLQHTHTKRKRFRQKWLNYTCTHVYNECGCGKNKNPIP